MGRSELCIRDWTFR